MLYHGTTEKKWKLIQEEGVLWGYEMYGETMRYRYTYLTPDVKVARRYGPVVLEVDLDIEFEGDQVSVFDPIPMTKVRRK